MKNSPEEILAILEQDSSKVFFESLLNFEGLDSNEYRKLVYGKKIRLYADWDREEDLERQGYFTRSIFENYYYVRGVYEIKFAKEIVKHFIDSGYFVVIEYTHRFLDVSSYDITPVKRRHSYEKILCRKNQIKIYSELYEIRKLLKVLSDEKTLEKYVLLDQLNARKAELEELDKIRIKESEEEWIVRNALEKQYEKEWLAEMPERERQERQLEEKKRRREEKEERKKLKN